MMKALIAEEEGASRLSLKSLLSGWGYEATICETGKEAWERYIAGKFHLVISDCAMPGISGLELCRKIRAAGLSEYCYFILLSSGIGGSDFLQEIDSGIDVFLSKPLDADELKRHLKVVESLMAMRSEEKLLPLCAWCRKMRIGEDLWLYLDAAPDSDFTYSICPHCANQLRSTNKSSLIQ